jgi:Ca2+-binding EF-hand superfamily protein
MKKSILLSSIVLFAAAGSFAGEQISEQQVAEADVTFQTLDQNADGYISVEEAASEEVLVSQFKSLDSDEDGMISEAEFGSLTETTN